MGWGLSSWLILVRLFQLIGMFVSGAMNGWLVYYIYTNALGLSDRMVIIEILVAAVFVYTSLSLLVIHTGRRSRSTPWLICNICMDAMFLCLVIAIISILAFTGVPSNCSGLTRLDFKKGDKPSLLDGGYNTIGFSNEQSGHRGELDRYCGMEKGIYFVAVSIIFTYLITISISILRICEKHYTKNSDVQYQLEEREKMIKLEFKIQETYSQSIPTPVSPSPMPTGRGHTGQAIAASRPPSATTYASARLPRAGPPSTANRPPPRPMFNEAMPSFHNVAGPSRSPSLRMSFASSSPTAVGAEPVSPISLFSGTTEVHANLAMVTDGSRYNSHEGSQLPPYSPGNNTRRMHGHGYESNDIRLSEYVKGETRAQDLKDAGGF